MSPSAGEWIAALVSLLVLISFIACSLLAVLRGARGRRRGRSEAGVTVGDVEEDPAWLRRIQVTESDVDYIRSLPQRRTTGKASPEWLRFRRHRLTASRFWKASAAVPDAGTRCPRDAQRGARALVEEMLTQPEARTSPKRFGVTHEACARQSYIGYRVQGRPQEDRDRFIVQETGLCVWHEHPWLAASPDGIVWDGDSVGALEIKCCRDVARMHSTENVPREYYDQMQGAMAVLSAALRRDVAWCDFFVWSPHRRRCCRVSFDAAYFYGQRP